MKKKNAFAEKLVKSWVVKLADPTPREWPPQCIGFMYQPVRPKWSTGKAIKEYNPSSKKVRYALPSEGDF